MKVLTIGGGGREHVAVEAFYKSGAEIYAVMKNANPGIIRRSTKYAVVDEMDVDKICDFAKKTGVVMAFIGPEAPLEKGIVDALEKIGIKCAGPTKNAAKIETSKAFMRDLITKYEINGNIKFASFNNVNDAKAYVKDVDHEVVVKPVGLTGGKGVKVQGEHLHSPEDVVEYIDEIFKNNIGGTGVILEEKIVGEEFTQMAFCDGKKVVPMPLVQDHKRAYEGDLGPNTGGMGSYSDSNHLLPFITASERNTALKIIQDVIDAMAKEGYSYHGPIYGQFMLTSEGPKIIEFNARLGDPEAMNVLSILETDFTDICYRMATGSLNNNIKFCHKATVCKYVVPEGYGVKPVPGKEIIVDEDGIKDSGATIYYANVNQKGKKLLTDTSRSIAIVGIDNSIDVAEQNCEKALKFVKCNNVFVRHDIGTKKLIQRRITHMQQLRSI
ncbi:MAG: phosphoribosylamine--glycine ligase [archaeon]|nr:phosphoribosylamine--glycine ligase [archaeon]